MKSVTIWKVIVVKSPPTINEWQFCIGKRKEPAFTAFSYTVYIAVKRLLEALDVKIIEKDWKE